MQMTSIPKTEQGNMLESFWTMLQECESRADEAQDPVLRLWVEQWYQQWNRVTQDAKQPRWSRVTQPGRIAVVPKSGLGFGKDASEVSATAPSSALLEAAVHQAWTDFGGVALEDGRMAIDPARLSRFAEFIWSSGRGVGRFDASNATAPKMDLVEHLHRQKAFSEKTFGPGTRTAGVCDHIRKELKEIEDDPHDLIEWIDVVLLALDGAWRSGHTPEEVARALGLKLRKNEQRDWPDWRTADPDKAIEHSRG